MPRLAACAAPHDGRRLLRTRIRALLRSPDGEFAARFHKVVAQVETSFRREEALLESLGDAWLHPRRADHAIILCALHRTAALVEGGNLERGRQVADALEVVLAPLLRGAPSPAGRVRPAAGRPH